MTLRLIEFIAYFSLVNFVFAIPFYVIKDRTVSLVRTRSSTWWDWGNYYNIVRAAAGRVELLQPRVLPQHRRLRARVCPKLSTTAPICGTSAFIATPEEHARRPVYQIGVALVVASGTLYVFGCPFF